MSDVKIIEGDCMTVMASIPDGTVDAIVTSPPYWGGLRDYGVGSQIGMERDPSAYITSLVNVFGVARRVLRGDGSLWLNIGDVFAAGGKGGGGLAGDRGSWDTVRQRKGFRMPPQGYKMKDLTLIAFQVADALRRDGWYLRATIIWRKRNSTEPKRVDRPSVSHEYLFLLASSEQYHVKDPGEDWWAESVWDIPSATDRSHPATMPRELARRCIVSSTDSGETVLDPFVGSGSTLVACMKAGRRGIGIEINPTYIEIARRRCKNVETPLFSGLEVKP